MQAVKALGQHTTARLFIISFLLLFAEVMCIRWLSVEFIILRTLPNLGLITIFVGTAIGLSGCRAANQSPRANTLIVAVLLTFALLLVGSRLSWMSFNDPSALPFTLAFLTILPVNLSFIFMALGRELGLAFERLPALKAYGINLAGSVAGVVAFAAVSWLMLPPAAWLAITGVLVILLFPRRSVVLVAVAMMAVSAAAFKSDAWSPYGRIDLVYNNPGKKVYELRINGGFFHGASEIKAARSIEDIKAQFSQNDPVGYAYRCWLQIPYLVASSWDRVLVLGSGSGNDVACALEEGARKVDAVERDPFIARCGFDHHPNLPYKDGRVSVYVEDARAFLLHAKDKYDLIQFAYLDPGPTVRASSFLRSDNFVYTEESLRQALSLLSPRGIISLSFASGANSPVTRRLYKTIRSAYGQQPMSFVSKTSDSCFFLFGPGLRPISEKDVMLAGLRQWPGKGEYEDTRSATDDWPLLYLDYQAGPALIYMLVMGAAAAMPLLLFRLKGAKIIEGFGPEAVSMLCLGMAFMLMETKAITQLSLLFGSTWVVSSIAILSILVLACLSNFLVACLDIKKTTGCFILLTGALLLDYFWQSQINQHTDLPFLIFSTLSALICTSPVFFGGAIFSVLLKRSANPVNLLAANTLGVAVGGLLENACIFTGIRALSLIALTIYLLAAVPLIWQQFRRRAVEDLRASAGN